MKIGILGVGAIGATLTARLTAAGHDVRVANSRGPETFPAQVTDAGGRPVHADDVATDVEALVVSIPLSAIPGVRPVVDRLAADAVLLDTSNYYPVRDGQIAALDGGQVESLWVSEQLGRPVVKAWNSIVAGSFAGLARPAGAPDRIALPVSADDDDADRALGRLLVEQTGFDAFDAGPLADSWRQQPGAPAYCTDLTLAELPAALAAADPARSPRRRDLAMAVIGELMGDPSADRGPDFLVRVNRLLYP
ncbi:NADPH-dependent F420 reductase [Modestobacter sp. Leaf380]|uniref:NADPH-dependent F420 reductase n=1 Tax=Modestobacter sp. Leaf380 TaxID=1736356 RepID=UPI000700CB1D|nr:NAD(P)-binding domain-containing protein [Modestobacter sp. Leaf380]KQS65897.1 NADP oxidoreductase [Modestobacter sp. Leaf380]